MSLKEDIKRLEISRRISRENINNSLNKFDILDLKEIEGIIRLIREIEKIERGYEKGRYKENK